ncbi:MAG: RluA family pseudouridine synthase [Deltaproteobacteria bacterium]|nr:RluA family pseudouridine synthase [Deltaproteobacteria bacterium]
MTKPRRPILRAKTPHEAHTSHARAPDPVLDFRSWIVFEDDVLVCVDKPAGVLSQGGEGGEGVNLVDLARAYLSVPAGVGVLHRLDRNVSGLVLLAKQPRAASRLSRDFAEARVDRRYEAVARCRPNEARWALDQVHVLDAWLAKDERTNQVTARTHDEVALMSVLQRGAFRPAKTEVRVLEYLSPPIGLCARCDLRPITGRSHQLRVHMAHRGWPLLGDPKYGVPAKDTYRPLLHATMLQFAHPMNGKLLTISSAVPWSRETLSSLAAEPRASRVRAR